MEQESTDLTPRTISERVREALLRALTAYYLGVSKAEAFREEDGVSREYFYSLKKSNKAEVEALEKEAKSVAQNYRESALLHLDTVQIEGSIEAQTRAIAAINEHLLERLIDIVALNPWTTMYRGQPVEVGIYPRDIAEAGRVLKDIAKDGLISQSAQLDRVMKAIPSSGREGRASITLPFFGAPTDWDKLRLERPDGTTLEASVKREDIIDVTPDEED
jgi:hypothetical protein